MSTEDVLANVPIFKTLGRKSLARIGAHARRRFFRAGDVIVREGEEGVGFFMISDGSVSVTRATTELARLGPGDFFGEMALLDNHRRSATVKALADTECLAIMRSDFLAEVRNNPDLAVEILSQLSQRVRALDEKLAAR
jgi:CRP-like cAMP-binding protein